MKPLLEISNLNKYYDKTHILKDINLTIEKNKIIGILGINGAGKSTLIKLIAGLLSLNASRESGEIKVNGHPIGPESKALVSYLPERNYLDKTKTIRETINYFSDFYADFDKKKAQKMLKNLGLDETKKISTLSKGMQEKVRLCLVMSRHAKLYLLDEPLGGVDPATRDYILDTILENFDDGASMIISTHLISDIERILDDVVFIKDGRILLTDSADNLRDKNKKSIDEIFRKEFKNAR